MEEQKEDYDPVLHKIMVEAREDVDRQRRLNNIRESKEQSEGRHKVLSKMSKPDLVELINEAWPDLEEFKSEKLSWKNLPFIPEDLGFREHVYDTKERGRVRVYYGQGITMVKTLSGDWKFKSDSIDAELSIGSKFVAYQVFRSMGCVFDGTESTVPNSDIPIRDILGEEE